MQKKPYSILINFKKRIMQICSVLKTKLIVILPYRVECVYLFWVGLTWKQIGLLETINKQKNSSTMQVIQRNFTTSSKPSSTGYILVSLS